MRFRLLTAALLLALWAAACSSGAPDQLNVVVTTGMIADVVRNVGGLRVHVTQLIGAEVDPHAYVATDNDKTALANAQIIFTNGLSLEAGLSDALAQVSKDKRIVPLAESLPSDKILKLADNSPDPHIWHDVSLWEIVTAKVRDELSTLDAPHADEYKANADKYLAQLTDLDQYIREQTSRVPESQRVLVTAHDAFRYFGRAYSWDVIAPNSSADSIQSAVQTIHERGVTEVFSNNGFPADALNTIIASAIGQGQFVEIGGTLYADTLGQSGTNDATYDGMMRHNVDIIVTTLLGLPAE